MCGKMHNAAVGKDKVPIKTTNKVVGWPMK